MNKSPDSEFDLDLHFLPEWAREVPEVNRYANFKGDEDPSRRDRPRRSGRPPQGRGPGRGAEAGGGGGGRDRDRGRDRGRDRDRRPGGRGGRGPGPGADRDRDRRPALPPLPELDVELQADGRGVASLARQIKLNGRAYPIFDIAHLILKKPERFLYQIKAPKKADGSVSQRMFQCDLDDTVFLSEDEAVQHILEKHLETFYQVEKIQTDPPKGTYTFVAQCGMSGEILGPPNFHDYQTKLHRLHQDRFSRMPFETFKSRVKIVRDEEVVAKWVEEQSWRAEYTTLNVPDPEKLQSRAEVTDHFRRTHLPNIVHEVDQVTVPADKIEALPRQLKALCRRAFEDQRRFPLKLVTRLSQQFAGEGLQFFKVKKNHTHVSVARPRPLDFDATPVSDDIKALVLFIQDHENCNRKVILDALAPAPAGGAEAEASAAAETVATEGAEASAPAEGGEAGASAAAPASEPPAPTPEQAALIRNLHWLIHQGHVIEFADGRIEVAKRRPPQPQKAKPKAKSETPATTPASAGTEGTPSEPSAVVTESEAPAEVAAEAEGEVSPVASGPVQVPVEVESGPSSASEGPSGEPAPDAAPESPVLEAPTPVGDAVTERFEVPGDSPAGGSAASGETAPEPPSQAPEAAGGDFPPASPDDEEKPSQNL